MDFGQNEKHKAVLKVSANEPGVCLEEDNCSNELVDILLKKVEISGEEKLCRSFISKSLFYNRPNSKDKYRVDHIGQGDLTKHITKGIYTFDLDQDGKDEKFIKVNIHSGAGNGCDQEYFQQVNSSRSKILSNSMNKALEPVSCRYYSDSFRYDGINYIVNRAARLDEKDLNIDPKYINSLFISLISEVYMYDGNNLKEICSYSY